MTKIDEKNLEIRKEFIQIASSNLFLTSLVLLLNIFIVVIAFWNIADKALLSGWLITLCIITLIRNINSKLYLKNYQNISLDSQEKLFKFLALINAIIVSSGFVYLLPFGEQLHPAFLIMVIAGISAGVGMNFSFYQKLTRLYLTILIMPLIYFFYTCHTETDMIMILLSILFVVFLFTVSNNSHKNIVKVIKSKLLVEKSQKDLKLSKKYFYTIFKEVPVGIFTFDTNLILKEVNQSFSSIVKAPSKKLIQLDLNTLPEKTIKPALKNILKGEKGFYEGYYKTAISKKDIYIKLQTVPMYDSNKNIIGGLGIVEDTTRRIEAEKKIKHHAYHDHLTNLANRFTLMKHLDREIARLSRHNRCGALLFIDIDKFKIINDTLGHDIGDIILKTFAQRALSITRKEDTVARFGGDEFVILLSDLSHDKAQAIEHSRKITKKLHDIMKKPINAEEKSINITLSIGVTIVSSDEKNIKQILKNADVAMYEAKETGRNTTCFFKD